MSKTVVIIDVRVRAAGGDLSAGVARALTDGIEDMMRLTLRGYERDSHVESWEFVKAGSIVGGLETGSVGVFAVLTALLGVRE